MKEVASEIQDLNEAWAWLTETHLFNLTSAVLCVLSAGLGAGLTIGLLSLDIMRLRIKTMVGTEEEKVAANTIMGVLKNHHLLLCTLLIFNSVANEALPLFLDELVPTWVAIILSVTFVLICGEIIPTAVFTGPNQLIIAAAFTPVVRVLIFCLYPIAFPLSKILDHVLGHSDHDTEEGSYNRDELSAMVHIVHQLSKRGVAFDDFNDSDLINDSKTGLETIIETSSTTFNSTESDSSTSLSPLFSNKIDNTSYGSTKSTKTSNSTKSLTNTLTKTANLSPVGETPLSKGEVTVITGLLGLAKKTIRDVMIPMESVCTLAYGQVMNKETMSILEQVGHSRIPVCEDWNRETQILGYLLVKKLTMVNPNANIPLSSIEINQPVVVSSSQSLLDVLAIFQEGSAHMALVSEDAEQLQRHMNELRTDYNISNTPANKRRDTMVDTNTLTISKARSGNSSSNNFNKSISTKITKKEMEEIKDKEDSGKHPPRRVGPDKYFPLPPPSCAPIGIVTIEDILEEMLQSEIIDEYDQVSGQKEAMLFKQLSVLNRFNRVKGAIPAKLTSRMRSTSWSGKHIPSLVARYERPGSPGAALSAGYDSDSAARLIKQEEETETEALV